MLKAERHQMILEDLRVYEKVYTNQLCEKFDVSEDTVRRDLNELAQGGFLKKVHGGAIAFNLIPSFKKREIQEIEKKHLIAKKAVNFLKEGQVLIIDGGTSNMQLVNILPTDIRLTVFTNSFPVASKVCEFENIEGFFFGGNILKRGLTTVGYQSLEMLKEIHADLCFLGITCVHPEKGLTEAVYEETLFKKAIMKASNTVISLVTCAKLGIYQSYKVGDVDYLDIMITELDPDNEILQPYINKGIKVY